MGARNSALQIPPDEDGLDVHPARRTGTRDGKKIPSPLRTVEEPQAARWARARGKRRPLKPISVLPKNVTLSSSPLSPPPLRECSRVPCAMNTEALSRLLSKSTEDGDRVDTAFHEADCDRSSSLNIPGQDTSNSGSPLTAKRLSDITATPNLRSSVDPPPFVPINHRASLVHDDDWISVSDDDEDVDISLSPRAHRKSLSVSVNCDHPLHDSYNFSECGSVTLDGFGLDVTEMGVARLGLRTGPALTARQRLVPLCKLGQGATGTVYKVFDLVELRLAALKVAPVFDRNKRRQIVQELRALHETLGRKEEYDDCSEASGRNCVVEFYDAFSNKEEGSVSLMVEYMDGGSIQDVVDAGGVQCEETLATVAYQCLMGLKYLHSCHQIHRDIKPANMLFSHKGEVKISDFGIVRTLQHEPELPRNLDSSSMRQSAEIDPSQGERLPHPIAQRRLRGTRTFVGTLTYMSPERINGQLYSFPSDIWSLGLALLTTALGRQPIDTGGGYWSILHCIRDDAPPMLPCGENWSSEFRDFLAQCLNKDPTQRLGCRQLLHHPFLRDAEQHLLQLEGRKRRLLTREQGCKAGNVQGVESLLQSVMAHTERLWLSEGGVGFCEQLANFAEGFVPSNTSPGPPRHKSPNSVLRALFLSPKADARLSRLAGQLSLSPAALAEICKSQLCQSDSFALVGHEIADSVVDSLSDAVGRTPQKVPCAVAPSMPSQAHTKQAPTQVSLHDIHGRPPAVIVSPRSPGAMPAGKTSPMG